MARGKSRSGTRDPFSESLTFTLRSRAPIGTLLSSIDDLRSFDFEPDTRPARLFTGVPASVSVTSTPTKSRPPNKVPYQIAFNAPRETLVCVRRKRRKEVLHAFKKTGKGGQRKPRRSQWSDTKC